MSRPTKSMLPSCGLYRTTKPLAGHEEQFPANLLVYFHNHSDSGLPQVLAPRSQRAQPLALPRPGHRISAVFGRADSLVKVPLEGFYVLRRELAFEGGSSRARSCSSATPATPIRFSSSRKCERSSTKTTFSFPIGASA